MKFLKLPYLVIRQILAEVPLSVFFVLSLCSARMRRILQNSKRRLLCVGLSSIETTHTKNIHYTCWGKERGKGISNMFILRDLKYMQFGVLNFCEPLPYLFDRVIGWYNFGFENGIPMITFVSKVDCNVQCGCHTYLNELFAIKSQLFHLSCPNAVRILKPNTVKNVIVSVCPTRRNATLTYRDVDDFFKKQPEKSLVILAGKMKDASPVVPNRLLTQVKNLVLEHPDNNNEFFLVFFQGEHLLITSNGFQVFFVNLLMRTWLDGKRKKLSSVIILTSTDMTEKEGDLLREQRTSHKAISITKHDQNKMFPYQNEIINYHNFNPDVFDCSGGYDIQRADGVIATMKLTPQCFTFFVWN